VVNLRTQSGPGDGCRGDQGGLGNKKIGQRPFIFPFYPAPCGHARPGLIANSPGARAGDDRKIIAPLTGHMGGLGGSLAPNISEGGPIPGHLFTRKDFPSPR
jgi:hypothetical protein